MELCSKGKLGDEEVSFKYVPGEKNGTLEVSGSTQRLIRDQDVIAVVHDTKALANRDEDHCYKIFHAANVNDPAFVVSKTRVKFESLQARNLPLQYLDSHILPSRPSSLFISPYRDGTSNLHVVISTKAGTGEAQGFFNDVLKDLLGLIGLKKESYVVHVTKSEKSISHLADEIFSFRANEGFAQTILLLSGDGGVVDVVNTLLSSSQSESYVKPVIGLLALGTGNALASSTGLRRGHDHGLRSLFSGKPHVLPTFTALFSPGSTFLVDEGTKDEPLPLSHKGDGIVYGAVVCSWALHASLVADSDTTEYRKHGNKRFAMAAKELLFPSDGSASHIYQGKISYFNKDPNGNEIRHLISKQGHMYMLASLVSNFEEHFQISPHSKPLDGQLRLLHFGAIPSTEVTKIMGLAYAGGLHINEEGVTYEIIDGFRIDFTEVDSRWRRICVDGKIVKVNEGGWVEVRKEGRQVVDILADIP